MKIDDQKPSNGFVGGGVGEVEKRRGKKKPLDQPQGNASLKWSNNTRNCEIGGGGGASRPSKVFAKKGETPQRWTSHREPRMQREEEKVSGKS